MNLNAKTTSPLHAILFDLDGTLLDTSTDLMNACNALLQQHHKKPWPHEILINHLESGSRSLLTTTFKLDANSPTYLELRKEFFSYYEEIIHTNCQAYLYPGILDWLHQIKIQNILWGVVTNKPKRFATPLMQNDLFPQTYSTLICPEDVNAVKPSPKPVLTACELIQCIPQNTLFVGDHERDIISGKQAGTMTCAALYGHIPKESDPTTWQADLYIKTPQDALDWLNKRQWTLPHTPHD